MANRLFLLDGMALVYRAHFALISRPILSSQGVNTSALYGFTQTLLEILAKQQPTHLAVAFDTQAPTARHIAYPPYKATRQNMPEELADALPHVRRMTEAFSIPVLIEDGFEADDIIGTLALRAEKEGFQTFMVTPDKDFGQLVDANTFLYKPSRSGDGVEIQGIPEIKNRWNIQRPMQVIDILALMGDASDNVPGVPGIGEKTAIKLIAEYDSVENLLAHTGQLKGKLKETLEANRDQALLSKQLVTIRHDAPSPEKLDALKLRPPNEEKVKELLAEFEFNSIGRRLFGQDFHAGRGSLRASAPVATISAETEKAADTASEGEASPDALPAVASDRSTGGPSNVSLKSLADVPHEYRILTTPAERRKLVESLQSSAAFSFKIETIGDDPKSARPAGLSFSFQPHAAFYVRLPDDSNQCFAVLNEFRPVFESARIKKIGHHLKFDLGVLKWRGLRVDGPLFDTLIAHSLIEPEMRHGLDYLAEVFLGRRLDPGAGEAREEQLSLGETASEKIAARMMENADVAFQLASALEPLLKEKGQERVFFEIETPLIAVLAGMEHEGIRVEASALSEFSAQLGKEIRTLETAIHEMAGREFNLNSPRQLGEVLFETLKIGDAPRKTKTGQFATDEQTLLAFADDHEIVRRLLDYRTASKLKSTYADALPAAIWPPTGRIHTTYNQVMTATGRLNSLNPNLQNIPVRTERGQEIRRAFVARGEGYELLSADYSQIELRIIAGLSQEPALLEAFKTEQDVHTATAARVFGVEPEAVTPEMRRKAKMVNYGIAYGISAFGLAQRLGIPRREGAEIIEHYFKEFPGIRRYMDETIAFARDHGYVQTVTGRRRYIRDIRSSNNTVRSAAERNAINAPIQGTAADMIKLAMIAIHAGLTERKLKTRMLLQVHDELVFDLWKEEAEEVRVLVEEKMKTAIALDAPMAVEIGVGKTWIDAH